MDDVQVTTVATVLGPVVLEERDGALVSLRFAGELPESGAPPALPPPPLTARPPSPMALRVRAYFEQRDLSAFDGIRTAPHGTDFQRAVWALVRAIPAGETRSYGELARLVGKPGASRAVGAANGANPICLVIPCHRVIGAGGKLTGYAYGLARKRWLLDHELSATAAARAPARAG